MICRRRAVIRLWSCFLAMTAISCALFLRGEIPASRREALRAASVQESAELRLFLRLAEEASSAAAYAREPDPENRTALFCACGTVCCLSELMNADGLPGQCASAAAGLFRTLSDAASAGTVSPWLISCAADCAELLTELSVLFLEGTAPETAALCADMLTGLCADFAPDPLRLSEPAERISYTFSAERIYTEREAADRLRTALGRTADLLSPVHTDEPEPVFHLFSCRNGYAEVSVRGGHLIRFALCPRQAPSDADPPVRVLSDVDLSRAAEEALSLCGLVSGAFEETSHEDLHGIRLFRYANRRTGVPVLIGVRLSDAGLFSFDAEACYRRQE